MFSWIVSFLCSNALATIPEQYPRLNIFEKPILGLYMGIGTAPALSSFDVYPQLAFQMQYHPIEPLWKPYVDVQLHASLGPKFDLKKSIVASHNQSSDTPIWLDDIDLFWLDYNLQSHLGYSLRIEQFFLRAGGAISCEASPGMYEQMSETYDLWVDWTTVLRGGVFLGAGTYIGSGEYLWVPTVSFTHLRGLTTGGGAMRLSDELSLYAFNQDYGTDFGHQSFAQNLSYASLETHMYHKNAVIHVLYQYGMYESSAVTKYLLDLNDLEADGYTYSRITVGTGILF